MYGIYHQQGETIQETALTFGGCIREPPDTVYCINIVIIKQPYCQVLKLNAFVIH